MKIRLKIDASLTKEELIRRLPDMAKAIAETILEKGMRVNAAIEAQPKSHPMRAIAAAEDGVYDQGSDALAGIYSWLMRKLNVEVKKGGDLSEDDFRHEMIEKFGIKLGSAVDHEQATKIASILSMFPDDTFEGRVETISVDGRFGSSKRKYPNHGRYYDEGKKIVLNPHIFGEDTSYTTDNGEKIEQVVHTLVHEIGHSVDDKHGLSNKKEWREISGWKYIGDGEAPEGYERMVLKEGDVETLKGLWAYRKGTNFPRWYGARNPKEDFCEAFAFAFLGASHYFKGQTGEAKLAFVRRAIEELEKSGIPGVDLETASIDDIAKSHGFSGFADVLARMAGSEPHDVFEKAAREYVFEECDGLFFEKSEGGESQEPKDTPAPAAAPAQSAAKGPNAQKGQQKPGHKYIKRETLPNGKFRYWYQMPTGEVYFNDGKPLHEEGKHTEQIPGDKEFGNWKANQHPSKMLSEPPPGVEPHFFDEREKPDLVNDIKPHAATFDPKATHDEHNESEKHAEDAKAERASKPKREQLALGLKVEDADKITAAQKTWEIEGIDKDFHSPEKRQGINIALRVRIKNDGEALLKPESASVAMKEQYVKVRDDIDEMSTVFREALAYNIDRALGWNLVPPTSIRKLKGTGSRRVLEAMASFGSAVSSAVEKLKDKTHEFASMQFFAKGSLPLKKKSSYGGAEAVPQAEEWAAKVTKPELIRGAIFDMIVNHQDRHSLNIMFAPDVDSANRYGGSHRLVMIDNGYAFGNGQHGRSDFLNSKARQFSGEFLDKSTLRDLRKLRDDLHSKMRRRKIVDDDIRAHVPADQIIRVAHRIDFILSDKNRDAKGRVKMPNWDEMASWESKNYPAKFDYRAAEKAMRSPFDVTGKTNLLTFNDKRVDMAEPPKMPKFKDHHEVQDFFHPLLPLLSPRQKEAIENLAAAVKGGDNYAAQSELKGFIKTAPKKLVSQMVINQRLAERFGFDDYERNNLVDAAMNAMARDYVGDFENNLRADGGEAAVEKHRAGLMDEAEVIKLVGDTAFRRAQDRWVVHPKLRGHADDMTSAIFDNPDKFGWKPPKPIEKKGIWKKEKKAPDAEKSQGEPALLVTLEK